MTVRLASKPVALEFPMAEMGEDIAVLVRDFIVEWDGEMIVVPAGFATDGTSVPGFTPNGFINCMTGINASVVHDWLYRGRLKPKEVCDRIFDELLELDPNVDGGTRFAMVTSLNSDAGLEAYWKELYVPEIVGQEEDIDHG